MSKYRILEKKGTYKSDHEKKCWYGVTLGCDACICTGEGETNTIYIPRYIVQKVTYNPVGDDFGEDLKEFTNLEEARQFKNELELEEGRIIE